MIQRMQITSIAVPEKEDIVLITVDIGIPGACGEFRLTPAQAEQFGHDLIGAARSVQPIIIRQPKHYTLVCEPGSFMSLGEQAQ